MRRTAGLTSLVMLCAAVVASGPVGMATAASGPRCSQSYGYAGVVGSSAASGAGASLSALDVPVVRWGHVAAWVGLSSGAAGATAWIQAGLVGFENGATALYYEVARPGTGPVYTEIRSDIPKGETHAVEVREVLASPGSWQVWIDGAAASPQIALPGSHAAWRPMVMAESWNGGTGSCNLFRFAISSLKTRARDGSWHALSATPRLVDSGYRLVAHGRRLIASGSSS